MPHPPCPPCPSLLNASSNSGNGGGAFTINVSNAILHPPGTCGTLDFTLHQLGNAPSVKVKGQCRGQVTVLAIASPLPWALLEVRPLAAGAA